MRCRFVTADVFTSRPLEGNPLAVFPDARGLSDALMQRIAREFNLSETVFVLPPDEPHNTRCLRIFTPKSELPFAGHPTVGTAYVLAALGEIPLTGAETRIVFEEGVGPVPVLIRSEDGRPVFTQLSVAKLPEQGPTPPEASELAEMLSLPADDLLSAGEDHPQGFSCGSPFLFIPLRGRDALRRARLRIDVWEEVLLGGWAREVFLFCREPELAGSHIRARMFSADGIGEDPATGAAVSALGGYLGLRAPETDGTLSWIVEQGFEMGRPSLLHLEVDKQGGEITGVRVGGNTVLVSEGTMEIPG
ncbi:MAG TPA: PhzF family phenazine biosynthesis protein [Thermoanaerobaculia bacterium]|nr:PhzF family phenazine biosynthesis protein [Thermoanaerobaculia bacterium]